MELEYLPQGNCDPRSPNVLSLVPLLRPDPEHMRFSCSRRTGGILSLPAPARRQDTLAEGDFSKWIVKNIDVWFAFARRLGLGITRMEDIVLVTGCHLARSWANIAFSEGPSRRDEQVSFGVQVFGDSDVQWQFPPEEIGGVACNLGPSGQVRICLHFSDQGY